MTYQRALNNWIQPFEGTLFFRCAYRYFRYISLSVTNGDKKDFTFEGGLS